MRKAYVISAVLLAASFLFGLIFLGDITDPSSRGYGALGILLFFGPCMLAISFVVLVLAFLTGNRKFLGGVMTVMLMIAAWMCGVYIGA